ncbi:pilus assembly protein N-terminal domain-containing protein [Phenylobacterium sp.]|jgi:Flp pilus assembly secretin CpaC|uniref:pilus assembly protein N-terminal domain-containing protein n=1 Tax=Phenylobacterium sp. TaxID=1871053 RepID=UPI002E359FB8|nr:pilus assembly protein N-terminal domain-containing protein [Phenylobacterium sp.]HEX2561530.1 pilus assembly protein N-terminal domain-containing protein [Phenylobacterium sp.]
MRLMLAAFAALVLAAPAAAETMRIELDHSTRIRLPSPARDVLLANPDVADVTMLDTRNLVVLGKAYGMTHLLVVDTAGRTIFDRNLVVSAPVKGHVSLYRGPEQRNYACAPDCEVAVRKDEDASSAAPAQSQPPLAAP